MWKFILFCVAFLAFTSCINKEKEGPVEFIQSNVYANVFLIKNYPKEDSILKQEIVRFINLNPKVQGFNVESRRDYYEVVFYKFTKSTSYFIDNKEYGGFESKLLSHDDNLGTYIISKCEADTTKFVGELFFCGLKGRIDGLRQIDTLIYHCN